MQIQEARILAPHRRVHHNVWIIDPQQTDALITVTLRNVYLVWAFGFHCMSARCRGYFSGQHNGVKKGRRTILCYWQLYYQLAVDLCSWP
jgi:hypothetical protein